MPTYKLMYFNITGLAEPIRYMFHYADIPFEDIRLVHEDWPKTKEEMPMRQVPVLEIDGKKYHQSRAIARYIAKQCNLYGSDDIEALEIDATIDSLDDIRQAIKLYNWEEDPVIKEKLKKVAFEKMPFYITKFEEQVKKNGGHFVRGKLTLPDIIYASQGAQMFDYAAKESNLPDHPELNKLVAKVNAIPRIKAYLEKRPKTAY